MAEYTNTLDARRRTGHPYIDSDHERVVALINQLVQAISGGEGGDVCARLLAQLIDDTALHFERENRLMVQCAYPDAAAHMAEHAKLLNEAMELKAWLSEAPPEAAAAASLLRFLENWWLEHVPAYDQALADRIVSDKSGDR